jgi:hypothetical protein
MTNLDDDFDFDSSSVPTANGERDSIANGELLRCIITSFSMPAAYLKDIEEKNTEIEREANITGIDPVLLTPTFKEGGIVAKVAVLFRQTKKDYGVQWNSLTNEVTEPNFVCYTQISMMPPPTIYAKSWSSFTKGLVNMRQDGNPYIGAILPSAWKAEDFTTKVLDPVKEKARLAEVQKVLAEYEALSEIGAERYLRQKLAQRFLLVNNANGKFTLFNPKIGLQFDAQARRKEGANLFDLQRFQWNSDKRQYDIYGNLFASIDDESVQMATDIALHREVKAADKAAERVASVKAVQEEEEVPF